MIPSAVGIAVLAFLISCGATWVVRRRFARIGFVDEPGPRKIHFQATPLGGGIAILLGFALPVVAGLAMAHLFAQGGAPFPDAIAKHFRGAVGVTHLVVPILLFAGTLVLVGLLDDRIGLPADKKLLAQVLIAGGLAASNIRVSLFVDSNLFGIVATVLWIVALINAFNLLDNCNGLCAGVAVVVSAILLVVGIQTGQWFLAALLLALIGSLLGFLVFNFPRASIFMGDAGSMLIGFLLAVITILFTFYSPDFSKTHWPILMPLLVMAVPLFDTGSVIFLRLRERRPVFQADARHLSHRLIAMGMSETWAVVSIWLLTFITGISATLLYKASLAGCLAILGITVAVLALMILIEVFVGRRP